MDGIAEFFRGVVDALIGVDDGVLAVTAGFELFEGFQNEVEVVLCWFCRRRVRWFGRR